MGRIRTIKPDFFRHVGLYDLEIETGLPIRVAFAALWTVADREGRFKWVPRQLKIECLPYDEVDFSRVLHALTTRDFIKKYRVSGVDYGWIPGFKEHQVINCRESASLLPDPSNGEALTRAARDDDASTTREVHAQGERKGKEGKGRDTCTRQVDPLQGDENRLEQVEPPPLPEGKTSKRKAKSIESPLPEPFQITDSMREWYSQQIGFVLKVERATEIWLDGMRSKGYRYADWTAAWRTGMRKQNEWASGNVRPITSSQEYSPPRPPDVDVTTNPSFHVFRN